MSVLASDVCALRILNQRNHHQLLKDCLKSCPED